MAQLGVTVAVMQEGTILLTKREDLEIWCLPGGQIEAGESLAQAAIRETREETGLEVRLTRLIGVYSRLGLLEDGHSLLFAAEPVGGNLRLQPGETVDVGWFHADALPTALMAWHQQPIRAALQGAGQGLAWTVHVSSPLTEQVKNRQDLYAMRDQSGLARDEFYAELMRSTAIQETLDVGEL
ncbi:MAG: NUDIX domain-containing protein [Caldilineaceae bacterium]|nr:NUDIX domain-containing protein [Caldilineaceae bacterium]